MTYNHHKPMTINIPVELYCCGCQKKVFPRLTDGQEIYPHRPDLYDLPFWKCDTCGNFVGCHHKTENRTRPLGCIPTNEIKKARKEIHKILDPIWQNSDISRNKVYTMLSKELGWRYHTAKIRSIEEARTVYKLVQKISKDINQLERVG